MSLGANTLSAIAGSTHCEEVPCIGHRVYRSVCRIHLCQTSSGSKGTRYAFLSSACSINLAWNAVAPWFDTLPPLGVQGVCAQQLLGFKKGQPRAPHPRPRSFGRKGAVDGAVWYVWRWVGIERLAACKTCARLEPSTCDVCGVAPRQMRSGSRFCTLCATDMGKEMSKEVEGLSETDVSKMLEALVKAPAK